VRRVIVDVRLNGGANNQTYTWLFQTLSSRVVNRPGRLCLPVRSRDVSAAGNFATDVEGHRRAISVGEPTVGGVNQYRDSTAFALPSTGRRGVRRNGLRRSGAGVRPAARRSARPGGRGDVG
jgi:hypothetical protein